MMSTFTTKWVIINTITGEAAKLDQLGKFQFWTTNEQATQFKTMAAARHVCDWLELHCGMRHIDFDAI